MDDVYPLVRRIDGVVSSIEQRLSHRTDVLRGVQFAMVGLAIGGAVLLMYAVQLMVLGPLHRLASGMASSKELRIRAPEPTAQSHPVR
jgi:nitrate/nitrite-specific signal transduction histidine kinase